MKLDKNTIIRRSVEIISVYVVDTVLDSTMSNSRDCVYSRSLSRKWLVKTSLKKKKLFSSGPCVGPKPHPVSNFFSLSDSLSSLLQVEYMMQSTHRVVCQDWDHYQKRPEGWLDRMERCKDLPVQGPGIMTSYSFKTCPWKKKVRCNDNPVDSGKGQKCAWRHRADGGDIDPVVTASISGRSTDLRFELGVGNSVGEMENF